MMCDRDIVVKIREGINTCYKVATLDLKIKSDDEYFQTRLSLFRECYESLQFMYYHASLIDYHEYKILSGELRETIIKYYDTAGRSDKLGSDLIILLIGDINVA